MKTKYQKSNKSSVNTRLAIDMIKPAMALEDIFPLFISGERDLRARMMPMMDVTIAAGEQQQVTNKTTETIPSTSDVVE